MTTDEFLRIFSETLGVRERLALSTKRRDVPDWDSLGQINILLMLNERFDVKLGMEELVRLQSVKDIVDVLSSREIRLD